MGNKVASATPLQRGIDRKNISWPVGRPPEATSRNAVAKKDGSNSGVGGGVGSNLWIIERSPTADGDEAAAKIVKVRRLLPDEEPPVPTRSKWSYSSARSTKTEPPLLATECPASPVVPSAASGPGLTGDHHESFWRRSKRSLRVAKRGSYNVAPLTPETRNSGVLVSDKQSVLVVKPREESRGKNANRAAVVHDGVLTNFQDPHHHHQEQQLKSAPAAAILSSPGSEDDEEEFDEDEDSFPFDLDASSSSSDSGEGFDFFDDTTSSTEQDFNDEVYGNDDADEEEEEDIEMKPYYHRIYANHPPQFAYPRSFDHEPPRERRNVVKNIYCMPRARDSGFEDGEYFPVKVGCHQQEPWGHYQRCSSELQQPAAAAEQRRHPSGAACAPPPTVAPSQFKRDKLHTRSLGRGVKRVPKRFELQQCVETEPEKRPESAPTLVETEIGDFDVVSAQHHLTFRRRTPTPRHQANPAGAGPRSVEVYTIVVTLVKRERMMRPKRVGQNRWSNSNSPRSTPRSSPRNSRDFDEPDSGFRDAPEFHQGASKSVGKDYSSGRCGRDTYSQEEILSLRQENERLIVQVRALQRDLEESKRRGKEALDRQAAELMGGSAQHIARMQRMDSELIAAKEALTALRSDRKRLKAEKFELLNQMKQLYATLEDKDKELRDFVRNYEQRMQESEMSIRSLAGEREVVERERWNLLKHVREESERCVQLAAELGSKDAMVRQLQDELRQTRDENTRNRLSNLSCGATSDAESGRDGDTGAAATENGGPNTGAAASTSASGDSGSNPSGEGSQAVPGTPNGRTSTERDPGIRGSSDRDSGVNTVTGTLSDSAASQEGASGGRTSTGEPIYGECTSGGSGSSHYQAPYYCQTPSSYYSSQYYRKAAPSLLYASITSRDLSSLNVGQQQGGVLSRSVEHIYSAPMGPSQDPREGKLKPPSMGKGLLLHPGGNPSSSSGSKGFGLGMKGTWGSISRVFSRNKTRKALDSTAYFEAQLQADLNSINNERHSWSPRGSMCAPTSPTSSQHMMQLTDSPSNSVYAEPQSYSEKLRLLEEAQTIPLEQWRAPTIQAWLELSLGMPQYAVGVAHNVKSGKVLLELSDSDLCNGLGISQPLHRKKLRLAIEEHRCPAICSQFPKMASLGHPWVALQWLQDVGLPQFAEVFAAHLIDGRMLEHLTKREMEKYLGVSRKFHQLSLFHAVHLLRMVQYDVQILNDRRQSCDGVEFRDPLVWTNQRFIDWVRSIDLGEYAENLRESGVHGALVVLEESFTGDTMASALGIPNSKTIIRRHLAAELDALVAPARSTLEEEIKRAKTERRRADKLSLGGSLGRNFSRSYAGGLQESSTTKEKEKDKENSRSRTSLRGSIGKAFGMLGSKCEELNSPPGSGLRAESGVDSELGDYVPNDDSLCSSPSEPGSNKPLPDGIRGPKYHLNGPRDSRGHHPPRHHSLKSTSETDSDSMLTITPV